MPNLLAIVAPLYECFVEGMKLDNVNIHGATLAALLQAVASSPGPCDGLLFGHVARHCHSKFSDSLEAIEVEEVVANVTSFLACSSSMSFYDGAGDVRGG